MNIGRSSYLELPPHFYARTAPTAVPQPRLIHFNAPLGSELGLRFAGCDRQALADVFSGNRLLEGATPLALGYAGHQFGHFVPQLGDGRAILLGEALDVHGMRRDIQLKGGGRTPYSRGGDGRAALGPVLREYIVSEAMHALGIPTTRSLAAVLTGAAVQRDTWQPGAILTRVAASHVRVGTFEYFAARQDHEAVRRLADYVIERHYPEARTHARPYLRLLESVIERQAHLIAQWMLVGFIHGVMNTDNMAVCGETIDYGPCAFMDVYDPATVFSSIDARGRYAFANQPNAAVWNLSRFAEALLPLIDADADAAVSRAQEALTAFTPQFSSRWLSGMRLKLGLRSEQPQDAALANSLLEAMQRNAMDYTVTFRHLCSAAAGTVVRATPGRAADADIRGLFANPAEYDVWASAWTERLRIEDASGVTPEARAAAMRAVNPEYVPRNHRIEQIIQAAVEHEDFGPFELLNRVLADPYRGTGAFAAYALPPAPAERVLQTFCGT